jgi:hypothetical protein
MNRKRNKNQEIPVLFRIDSETKRWLINDARENERSVSSHIRHIVKAAMAREKEKT